MTEETRMTNDESPRAKRPGLSNPAPLGLLCIWTFALTMIAIAPQSAIAHDAAPAGPISIHPPVVELRHPRQQQSLQVLGMSSDGFSLDLSTGANFTSADPNIAAVDERGWVRPVATGQTQVTIVATGQTLTIPVSVQL